jgi:hypothetical protein
MTSKEKAKELFDSYWYCLLQSNIENRHYWAQQCALIAVDELIDEQTSWQNGQVNPVLYWQEVKKEIEKI